MVKHYTGGKKQMIPGKKEHVNEHGYISSIERSNKEYDHPGGQGTMKESARYIDWKDLIALTIASIQVLAPRVALLVLSYLLVVLGIFWVLQ